eukprot:gnl/Chilomastix_caulleri/455.p2 GENE.gnl/Chilomastix_caulleri/455~~gnl/Chilomastix_caulleri/455.p2  ORF type:complete len:64 (+),score=4.52 gnl/Chilomastix_caulleri/455:725-916(+)
MGQLERILEIFVQMFNDDEIQQCISNHSHVGEYIAAILVSCKRSILSLHHSDDSFILNEVDNK